MAQHPAWEKLESLVNEVKSSPRLQAIFQTGTQAERIAELIARGFTLEDLRVLSEGAEAMAGDAVALGPGWWMW